MNDDSISRQAAAEVIYKALKTPAPDYRKDPFHDTMGLAIAMANEIPSAQPEQRWIPCSERLPKKTDYRQCHEVDDSAVQWCDRDGMIGIGYYYESTKKWSDIWDRELVNVIAWQSLPEPYQEENHERI